MKLHELHNTLTVEIVQRLLAEIRMAGGDATDLILILCTIVAGTINEAANSQVQADAMLATFNEEVGIRLAEIRARRPMLN